MSQTNINKCTLLYFYSTLTEQLTNFVLGVWKTILTDMSINGKC